MGLEDGEVKGALSRAETSGVGLYFS
jgi:hypothetical protein